MKKLLLAFGLMVTTSVFGAPVKGTDTKPTTTATPDKPTAAEAVPCLEDKTKTCAQIAACPDLKGKTATEIAKMQLGSLSKGVSAIVPVVNGVTNFVNNTVPLLKQLPDVASATVDCAKAKTPSEISKTCKKLTKDSLSQAKLPVPPVMPGDDKESRYAFAMYNFSSILTKLGDGFFAQIEGGKLKGGLLFSFLTFLQTAQPQRAQLCDAKNRMGDIRLDIESLRKALKYLGDGLKYASEQKKMKAEAKAAKEADPFAAEPINMEEIAEETVTEMTE